MTSRLVIVLAAIAPLAAAPPQPPFSIPLPGLVARGIGPATMSGRITSLAVVEKDPDTHYVGAASGGLWKTSDDGKNWTCVFAGRPHASVGAVAVAPSNSNVIYLGTGEANARNSVTWGNGIFVSRDAGKTWTHAGLADTHHVGRIVVHPTNPNVAYVAALGHLWGPNRERGLFATRDGGQTWEHVLALDSETGCIDVVLDPSQPRTVYAAAYRVRRDGFSGGNPAIQFGPRAGIYRSLDAGKTWKRLSGGLPRSPMGRIGLAAWRKNPKTLFAVIQTDRTDISRVPGQSPGHGPIETGGVFLSRDRGDTWVKVNDLCPRPFYFGQVRIDPDDANVLWILGIPLFVSVDGGRSFNAEGARTVHVDHHDLWVNPRNRNHLILANDGGLAYSRDRGHNWTVVGNLPLSQFYAVAVDHRPRYRIYGGLQDNGTWGGPSRTTHPAGIFNTDWTRILAMDGFQCQVPPDDDNTVYAEGQYGRLHRIDLLSRRALSIKPRSLRSDTPSYRHNWSSPLVLSAHDSKMLYFGGNRVFRSVDRGNSWRIISPDLTHGKPGTYPNMGHTLTALGESPVRKGYLYAGSDDGRIHVTRDDGKTWTELSNRLPGVPPMRTITRIECSPHAVGTAWLSLSRHRQDDRRPYLFRTDDFGKTWKSSVGNLPTEGPIHVVRASSRNDRLLFVGTEFGLYLSLDGGVTWREAGNGLPPCPVHDLVIHPRERELVVGTHGRGLYVLDVAPLEELTAKVLASDGHLFSIRPATPRQVVKPVPIPEGSYLGQNPPEGAVVTYWLGRKGPGTRLEIVTVKGEVVANLAAKDEKGLHRAIWDLRDREKRLVAAGTYRARLRVGTTVVEQKLEVRAVEILAE